MKSVCYFLTIIGICILTFSGCSGGNNPMIPDPDSIYLPIPDSMLSESDPTNHQLLGTWDMTIDPQNLTADVVQCRDMSSHYKFTLPFSVVITDLNTIAQTVTVDLTIENPYPLSGYDLRLIIYTDSAGHKLLNPDSWTNLFDIGGGLPINPFKAYANSEPNREFYGESEFTESLNILLPGMNTSVKLGMEVSYPSNCAEPFEISQLSHGTLLNTTGSSTDATVYVHDWQNDIAWVALYCPDVCGGSLLQFDGYYEERYATLVNNTGATPGRYTGYVMASSSGGMIYNEVSIVVSIDGSSIITDLSPESINLSVSGIAVDGNYAYVAGGSTGVHIFDVTDPQNPVWLKVVKTEDKAMDIRFENGYVFAADHFAGLTIIDVSPVEFAYVVMNVPTNDWTEHLDIAEGYAYLCCNDGGVNIIDIDPPESAHVVRVVGTNDWAWDICVDDNYAYVADFDDGFCVIDITNPTTAYLYNSMDINTRTRGVDVSGGYAYLAATGGGLKIIDIDPPNSLTLVKEVSLTRDEAWGVCVSDGYAYVANENSGIAVVDVEPYSSASIVQQVSVPGYADDVITSGNYAFVSDNCAGFVIMDITDPISASIDGQYLTLGAAKNVWYSNGYAYVADYYGGVMIVDVSSPDNSTIVKHIDLPYQAMDIETVGGYAYVCTGMDWGSGTAALQIIDIDPPETASVVKQVTSDGPEVWDISVANGYAYITSGWWDLKIFDVDPPGSASRVKTVDTGGGTTSVFSTGNYTYVEDCSNGFFVLDTQIPESATVINNLSLPRSFDKMYVKGNYLYSIDLGTLYIIGISSPGSEYIVKEMGLPVFSSDVEIAGEYAFIASDNGLLIYDINPPGSAYLVSTYETPGYSEGISVNGNMIYLASIDAGLRILKLL